MLKNIRLIVLWAFVFALNSFAIDEKSIIDGASQFLIERAQQNYLYIFEKQIKKDSLFTQYFPKTTKALSDLDLTMLLTIRNILKKIFLRILKMSDI